MVRVKICGVTNLKDALAAIDAGADALGFVFAKSPRRIKPSDAAGIIGKLPVFVNCVGVFVNESVKSVEKIAKQCKLDTLQFHGEEGPEYCRHFKKTHKVIKAFKIKDIKSLKIMPRYDVDGYLLDTYARGAVGGTGLVFDWAIAKRAKKMKSHLILSGGLDVKNVKNAVKIVRPYAVDVSSGVEARPGKKNLKVMREFIKAVKYE
ncbi:MAG: phosphoribosylanthranilate isomerase [Candidatus Omnitrophica bacterium]|nr:phosphoribosylanthranilate isomerase [Candidatus Omnitrophota bacterium]